MLLGQNPPPRSATGWAGHLPSSCSKVSHYSVTALDDIVIVVEDPKNIVTALSTRDGKLLWKVNIGSDIESIFPLPGRRSDLHPQRPRAGP